MPPVTHGLFRPISVKCWQPHRSPARKSVQSTIPEASAGLRIVVCQDRPCRGAGSLIVEHGELGAALLDYHSGDLAEAQEAIAGRHDGRPDNLAVYMQELSEETTVTPTTLRHFIDFEAMARAAELGGDLFTIETAYGEAHVFGGY